jgi:hypothetical protein
MYMYMYVAYITSLPVDKATEYPTLWLKNGEQQKNVAGRGRDRF